MTTQTDRATMMNRFLESRRGRARLAVGSGILLCAWLAATLAAAGEPPSAPPVKADVPAVRAEQKPVGSGPEKDSERVEQPLDLEMLEKHLKETSAIGVFTKLTLKNQVDDLLDRFRAFYEGGSEGPPDGLRQPYDLLLLKTITVVQDGDPALASAIASSREAIWEILADRDKFAALAAGI